MITRHKKQGSSQLVCICNVHKRSIAAFARKLILEGIIARGNISINVWRLNIQPADILTKTVAYTLADGGWRDWLSSRFHATTAVVQWEKSASLASSILYTYLTQLKMHTSSHRTAWHQNLTPCSLQQTTMRKFLCPGHQLPRLSHLIIQCWV